MLQVFRSPYTSHLRDWGPPLNHTVYPTPTTPPPHKQGSPDRLTSCCFEVYQSSRILSPPYRLPPPPPPPPFRPLTNKALLPSSYMFLEVYQSTVIKFLAGGSQSAVNTHLPLIQLLLFQMSTRPINTPLSLFTPYTRINLEQLSPVLRAASSHYPNTLSSTFAKASRPVQHKHDMLLPSAKHKLS